MANDRLYIRCACGGPVAMLAKLFGEWAAWDLAADNLDLFFEAHRGCEADQFSLVSENETVGLPTVHGPRTPQPSPSLDGEASWQLTLAPLPDADCRVLLGWKDGTVSSGDYFDGEWCPDSEYKQGAEPPAWWAPLPSTPEKPCASEMRWLYAILDLRGIHHSRRIEALEGTTPSPDWKGVQCEEVTIWYQKEGDEPFGACHIRQAVVFSEVGVKA